MCWVANKAAHPTRRHQSARRAHGRHAMQGGGGIGDEAARGKLEGLLARRRFDHQLAAIVGLRRRQKQA